MNENKRDTIYLDFLRIISIFAMIVLHVSTMKYFNISVYTREWNIMNIYDSMVRFCVPVMVMISGVLFLDPHRTCSGKYICKKVKRLVIAFIIWSLIYFLKLRGVGFFTSESVDFRYFIIVFISGNYHMWFIYMIIGLYIITPLVRRITCDKKLCEYLIILWLVFQIICPQIAMIDTTGEINKFIMGFYMFFPMGYLGYFVLGYYLHNFELKRLIKIIIYALAIIGILVTILLTKHYSQARGEIMMYYYENLTPNVCFVSIGIFCLFNDVIPRVNLSSRAVNFVKKISRLCFGVYLIHDLFLIVLKDMGITTLTFNTWLSVPILSIIVFFLSLFAIFIISKIPILNKYLI